MDREARANRNLDGSAKRYTTPGELAKHLDNATIQTPALDIIDEALVQVDEAVNVMLERREIFEHLADEGMDLLEALHQAADEVPDRGISRLIISLSPQEGKSQRVSRRFPTWELLNHQELRIAIASYELSTARRWGRTIRDDLIGHDLLKISDSSAAAHEWYLKDKPGGVYSVGIGGALTGRPVDLLLIDDPIKDRMQADSITYRENVWNWWTDVAQARLAPGAPVVLILTRWHEDDLAGRLLAAEDGHLWHVINIPALADHDPAKGQTDPLGRGPGEWMLSARGRTEEQWQAIRLRAGARTFTSLYQGRPSPEAGDVLQRQWWQRYYERLWSYDPVGDSYVANGFSEIIQSWDMAFKDTKGSDFVVGQVWGRRGPNAYLLYQVHERMTFTETVASMREVTRKWPGAVAKLVEDKANGTAVIDTLRKEIGGIIPITPKESKYARASAVAPMVQSGNAFLPASDNEFAFDESIALFNPDEFIEEAAAFPNSAHDDQVDAFSQAFARFYLHGASGGKEWLESLAPPCASCGYPNDPRTINCAKCGYELRTEADIAVEKAEEAEKPFVPYESPEKQYAQPPDKFTQDVMAAIAQYGPSNGMPPGFR